MRNRFHSKGKLRKLHISSQTVRKYFSRDYITEEEIKMQIDWIELFINFQASKAWWYMSHKCKTR